MHRLTALGEHRGREPQLQGRGNLLRQAQAELRRAIRIGQALALLVARLRDPLVERRALLRSRQDHVADVDLRFELDVGADRRAAREVGGGRANDDLPSWAQRFRPAGQRQFCRERRRDEIVDRKERLPRP